MNDFLRRVGVLGVALATASAALVAAPSAASAMETTGEKQLVVSHVRTFSLVATPAVNQRLFTVFDAMSSTDDSAVGTREETEGDSRIPLSRSHPTVTYQDGNFNASAQWSASSGVLAWGAQMSAAWQSVATGPVTELTYWWVNNGRTDGSGHTEPPSYHFHGSVSGLRPGDVVDIATELTFECGPDTTCDGRLWAGYYLVD